MKFKNPDQISISRRTVALPIPENCLSLFDFENDESRELICQNLTGEEIYFVREGVNRNSLLNSLAELLAQAGEGGDIESRKAAMRKAAGISGDEIPDEYVRHVETIIKGVLPSLSRDQILKLSEANGVYFRELALTVMKLSGEGGILKGE